MLSLLLQDRACRQATEQKSEQSACPVHRPVFGLKDRDRMIRHRRKMGHQKPSAEKEGEYEDDDKRDGRSSHHQPLRPDNVRPISGRRRPAIDYKIPSSPVRCIGGLCGGSEADQGPTPFHSTAEYPPIVLDPALYSRSGWRKKATSAIEPPANITPTRPRTPRPG